MQNKIYYLGILFLLFGNIRCTSKINTKNPENNSIEKSKEPKLQRIWMLTEFAKFEKKFLIKSEAQLNLTNFKKATASMGCNSITVIYTLKSNSKITFTDGIRTEMACEDMNLENNFLRFITKIDFYKINGHTLTLYNSKNEKMVFIAQDWD